MLQLKTSTKLVMTFTIYVMVILLLLGVVVNLGGFFQRYKNESRKLLMEQLPSDPLIVTMRPKNMPEISVPKRNVAIIENDSLTQQELRKHRLFGRLTKFDHQWVLFRIHSNGKRVTLVGVEHFMEHQLESLRIWGLALLLFGFLTYGISKIFVSHALRRLWTLSHSVQGLDIHSLDRTLSLDGPEDDEIRQIAVALNTSFTTMRQQTHALKDFVAYASHELKTPLMSMSSNLDIAEKTKDFGKLLIKQKLQLKYMSDLFDKLLLITKQEFSSLQLEEQDIVVLIDRVIENMKQQQRGSAVNLIREHPTKMIKDVDAHLFQSIVSNILSNAYKYVAHDGTITVQLNAHTLSIANTGSFIAAEEKDHIFERFWKKDSNGYGLGLYLSKLLVEKHGWEITVASEKEKATIFTIHF